MKTPWYESSAGITKQLLASRQWVECDLYTITTIGNGPVLRYTTGVVDVTVPGGDTWSSKAVRVDLEKQRALCHWKRGLDVDQWQVILLPRLVDPASGAQFPDTIGSTPWLHAARAGALNGATLQVDRAIFAQWPTAGKVANPDGVITIFFGRMAEVDVGRTLAVLTANSHTELLTFPMPRQAFQAGCVHTLFDAGCTLLAANFAVNSTIGSASAGNVINSSAAKPGGSGTYALGRLKMTSGLNAGFSRMVRSWTPGVFTLLNPFPFALSVGDTLTAYPGCDKTQPTCTAFGNLVNFGGEPYIPAPETAI